LKLVPVLGTLVLVGAIVQLILGLQITGASLNNLIPLHMLIGVVGLALVIVLCVIAFRTKTATKYSRIIITVLTLVVLAQVGLGLQLLQGADMTVSHEANGFLIVILTFATGASTMQSARKRA
jgi:heme/copper-type cytochrome/quinol oxidase subunit 4